MPDRKQTLSSLLLVALSGLTVNEAVATSIRFASFGAPVVVRDRLVFAEHFWEANRLICIDKQTGKKLWETIDRARLVKPWFVWNDELIVTVGSDLQSCDIENGKLTSLHKTGFERCGSVTRDDNLVLVTGHRQNIDYISAVDPGSWRKLWETRKIHELCAKGSGVLLCVEGTRKATRIPKGGYRYTDNALVGISRETGKVLWHRRLGENNWTPPAVAIGDYFVVGIGGTALCLRQTDGHVLKELKLTDGGYMPLAFALRGERVLMWLKFSVSELTVPDLQKRDLLYAGGYSAAEVEVYKDIVIGGSLNENHGWQISTGNRLWKEHEWDAAPVHEGFIYFGKPDDRETTSMNRIEVSTGKVDKLCSEPLNRKQ
jgi:hypothetical protein